MARGGPINPRRLEQGKDCNLESGARSDVQAGYGPVIPDFFKATQHIRKLATGKGANGAATPVQQIQQDQQDQPQVIPEPEPDDTLKVVAQWGHNVNSFQVSDNITAASKDSTVLHMNNAASRINLEASVAVSEHGVSEGALNRIENMPLPQHTMDTRQIGQAILAQQ
ncbi:hypothetical protein NDU88_010003 [Pleurodeles waltl]|uniref:Uncharacterized protein n=1 Tax=Pleurodeles waltl TaxID=8319 RepID=A0AAV7S206_PLEWA|nr:hypothetical protein NDU88_010003 [Pleurodeles waltl]